MIKIPMPQFKTWHETLVKSEYTAEVIFHDEVNDSVSRLKVNATCDKVITETSMNNRSSDCKVYMDYFIDKLKQMDKEDLMNFLKSKSGIDKFKL